MSKKKKITKNKSYNKSDNKHLTIHKILFVSLSMYVCEAEYRISNFSMDTFGFSNGKIIFNS